MTPGQRARVTNVVGSAATRQRMLDMGILPDVLIEVERTGLPGDSFGIRLEGYQVSLSREEAEAVVVVAV